MYFTELSNCAGSTSHNFDIASNLFQKVDSLQLRTNIKKDIPELTLSEFISVLPIDIQSNLRGSISGMDIEDHAKVYTDVFDREGAIRPDIVIEGSLGTDGSIADLSAKRLRSSVKSIALRSKETVNGNLNVTALDNNGATITEYMYTPYQIVYLRKNAEFEERFVSVSIQTCRDNAYFVTHLGDNVIRHDRNRIPFRVFLALPEAVQRLSISFKSKSVELAIPQ